MGQLELGEWLKFFGMAPIKFCIQKYLKFGTIDTNYAPYKAREDARGVAGVAAATPKFQVLLYKMVLKWISKKFLYTAGYPNLKFLTSSLYIASLKDTFTF